jgi:N-acetylglutamate synthase-like GNAT family acetyltransferase
VKYRIVDDLNQMDLNDIIRLLKSTYWADKRSAEQIEKSARNSSCYGIFIEGENKLAGFARVISDYATTYYLCDVVVDEEYRNKGLGTALVSYIESLPVYAGLRGILVTRDAHSLYRKFGYEVVDGRVMIKGLVLCQDLAQNKMRNFSL